MDAGAGAGTEWRRHWKVVMAGALATMLPTLHIYSLGVMIPDLEREFGWSRTQIASGPMIISLIAIGASPLVGIAVDRVGPRRVGIAGGIAYCLLFALLATATADARYWWLLWTLLALAAAAVTPAVWTAAVSQSFVRGRGLAIALTLTGTGLGAIVVPLLTNRLLGHGWRAAFVGLAAMAAAAVLPALCLFFDAGPGENGRARPHPPAESSAVPRVRGLMLSSRYLKLAFAAGSIALVGTGISVNVVPILLEQGIGATEAAGIAGFIGLGSISGRLVGGWLLDRISGNIVGGAAVVIPVLSIASVLADPGSAAIASAAALGVGLAIGIEYDVVAYLTARHFGVECFGRLFGTITGIVTFAAGIGPLLASYLYDVAQSYFPAVWIFVPVCLLSSAAFLTLGPYPRAAGERPEARGAGRCPVDRSPHLTSM